MNATQERPRRRVPPIPVWCSEAEREAIVAGAQQVGLSASAYLRRLGLGYTPKSMVDIEQVQAMLKVAGDAGRIGGLLKMWLTDDERLKSFDGDMRPAIQAALMRIGETQVEIHAIAETVLKARG